MNDLSPKYWEGRENLVVRCWMYIRMANSSIGEFRTYGYILTGIYVGTPYLQDKWMLTGAILLGIIVVSVPLMILFGRWLLYKANPAMEYASAIKGSVYGFKAIESSIETAENTREILKELRNKPHVAKNIEFFE